MIGNFGLIGRESLVKELARLSIKPDQISIVGISHFHFDHTGQAADFAKARLLIARADWEARAQK
jgi:glyoxylase-like metal-dependent hydrolase (beta-lactamase superfamily II)